MSHGSGSGIGSRTERKKEETKKKIVGTAMRLFSQNSFDLTTMEEIARETDIAKGTLYNYFPVKEAILSEFIRESFKGKNAERMESLRQMPDTRSRMILILTELIEGVQKQKDIFEKYFTYEIKNMLSLQRSEGFKSGFRLLASETVKLGQKSGELRSDLPFDIMVAFFEFVFVEVVQEFYMDPEKFQSHVTIEQCVDLFMNGAVNQNSRIK